MVTRKYVKDYKIAESLNSRGGICSEAVYVGKNYCFSANAEVIKKTKVQVASFTAAGWLLWILALIFKSQAARTIYIIMPYVISALPFVFMTDHVLAFLRRSEPLTRQLSDRISGKLPADAAGVAVLTGLSATARLISAVVWAGRLSWGDAAFGACAAGVCVCTAFIFSRRADLATRTCE